jgi:hypothetical protein
MRNLVTFTQPKFKPLPGELTPERIREATLPVKIGIAQRAIAACCDLSELLTWKDKLAALAAAAKMAKMPELSRDVNRVHKEAIFRMGEILLQYSGAATSGKGLPKGRGRQPSERALAAAAAGIPKHEAVPAARLGAAPSGLRRKIIENDLMRPAADVMARNVPHLRKPIVAPYSDAAMLVFYGSTRADYAEGRKGHKGLTGSASSLRTASVEACAHLTAEEKSRARNMIVEMQEILDAMMQRLELAP